MNMSIFLKHLLGGCIFLSTFCSAQQQTTGLGIVKLKIVAGTTLYLYTGELVDDGFHHSARKDSLTFIEGKYNIDIGTAPPWFVPELLKLDYDLFYLRAVTIARNWIEVIVNKKTGQTAWVERQAVDFSGWPEFFLEVYSIELLPNLKNLIRIKPQDNASVVSDPGRNSLKPIAVQGEWMKVATLEEKPVVKPRLGWIRWKKGNQMLITWSPLS